MRRAAVAGLAALFALGTLSGCSGDDSGGGADAGSSASPSSDSASAAASENAQDAAQLFQLAVKPLVTGHVIDFRYDVYSGDALAVETRGRAFQGTGWQATSTSPKQLGSEDAPQGDDVKGRLDVRSVGTDLFMQLSSWQPPLAGCWLRTGGGQVPGGQLAMTAGVPGYVTLLGALQPQQAVAEKDGAVVVAAELPLRVGLQLLTTGVLGLLQLQADQLDGGTIVVGVKIAHKQVSDVELQGSDLVSAVRAAGGDVAPDAEATLGDLKVDVSYKVGPDDSTVVTAPPAGQVMTNADVRSGRGC